MCATTTRSGASAGAWPAPAPTQRCPPPFGPRTKWTRRVPHPVLIGHVSSLPRAGAARYPAAARRAARILAVIGRLLLAAALKGRDADRLAAPPRTTKPTDPRSGCAPFPAVRQRSLTSVRAPAGGGQGRLSEARGGPPGDVDGRLAARGAPRPRPWAAPAFLGQSASFDQSAATAKPALGGAGFMLTSACRGRRTGSPRRRTRCGART
jgi:hypothetical protein